MRLGGGGERSMKRGESLFEIGAVCLWRVACIYIAGEDCHRLVLWTVRRLRKRLPRDRVRYGGSSWGWCRFVCWQGCRILLVFVVIL